MNIQDPFRSKTNGTFIYIYIKLIIKWSFPHVMNNLKAHGIILVTVNVNIYT